MSRKEAEIDPKSGEAIPLGGFRFLLDSKELLDPSGNIVVLRSQSTDVLDVLARNVGVVVSKDTLIDEVWPDVSVTEDSLVQCIGDIRRALGDTKREIVQTFPKKGYRLNELETAHGTSDPPASGRGFKGLIAAGIVLICLSVAAWFAFTPTPPHPAGEKPRIAVLAFDDFSTGDNQGYLSDAIAEGIITELARNSLIAVIARNSSFRYRNTEFDVRAIGEELGVHYVLEGSQQKNGNELKVTVQLINAVNGEHIWAHTYDQHIDDLFAVQDAIIKTVADRIGVRIRRPIPGADPEKVTALHLYLQGLNGLMSDFNAQTHAQALDLYSRSIEADPDAQYGYIGLAHAYRIGTYFGWLDIERNVAMAKAYAAAETALRIAPEDPEVHYVLARLYTDDNEREKAMASYDKAIALNPSSTLYLIGSTDLLLYSGQKEQALERLKQAEGIDPFPEDQLYWKLGWALWEVEDCQGALEAMLKMRVLSKGAHRQLAAIYACLGDVEKAQEAYQVFYADAHEPTISEQREAWKDLWTAPGSLERWLDHMRIAGMKDG